MPRITWTEHLSNEKGLCKIKGKKDTRDETRKEAIEISVRNNEEKYLETLTAKHVRQRHNDIWVENVLT